MQIVTVNGTQMTISDPEARALAILAKRGPSPMSAFEEGTSKKWLRTSLPLKSARQKELGIITVFKNENPDHPFWVDNPRHLTVIEGSPLATTIYEQL